MRPSPRLPRDRSVGGFTLIDMIATMALVVVGAALALPVLNGAMDKFRLRTAAREVERDLQTARLRAVSSNRPMRVRFNCPETGQFRVVELIGTPSVPNLADSSADRCLDTDTRYPYPPADRDPLTRPNLDGPLRTLHPSIVFASAPTIEFWPDGTAHTGTSGSPWPLIGSTGASVTLTKGSTTNTITVNGLGKIQTR